MINYWMNFSLTPCNSKKHSKLERRKEEMRAIEKRGIIIINSNVISGRWVN